MKSHLWLATIALVWGCDEDCLTCVGHDSDECTSCGSNAHLVPVHGPAVGQCECDATYCSRPNAMNCVNTRHPSCSAALGCGANQCTACTDTTNAVLSSNSCLCLVANICVMGSNGICQAGCRDSDCLTCSNCTNDTCASCSSNASLSSGDCDCISSKYEMFDARNCVTSCGTNMHVDDGKCKCNSRFYRLADHTCGVCDSLCDECKGPSANECSSCKDSNADVNNSPGACTCKKGYYPNSDANTCSSCDSTCEYCSGSGASACFTCQSSMTLNGTPPTNCVCPTNSFWTGAVCTSCDSTCATCQNTGASQCLTCVDSHASIGTSPGTCVCVDGYYGSPNSCTKCADTCKTCNGAGGSSCVLCFDHATENGSGACVCDAHYWPDADASKCSACDVSCSGCSSATSCSSCYLNASSSGAFCTCDAHYFPNATPVNCSNCEVNCLTCSGPNDVDCQSCASDAHLSGGKCVCNDGFYANTDANSCAGCAGLCATCQSGATNSCLSCPVHGTLGATPGPSTCSCDAGYGWKSADRSCVLCDATCASCSDTSVSGCLSCKALAELNGSFPTNCKCSSGAYPANDTSNCVLCHSDCLTCSGPANTQCSTCQAPANYSAGSCLCPAHYTRSPDAKHCGMCHHTCAECVSVASNLCTSCQSHALVSGPAPGECICEAGYFTLTDSANCQPCDSSCRSCSQTGPNMCLSCPDFAELTNTAPSSCTCIQTAFPSPDVQHCSLCVSTCLSCVQGTAASCLSCPIGAVLSGPAPNTCQCQQGYFPSPDAANCFPCDSMCMACSGLRTCLSCHTNAELKSDHSCSCSEGYQGSPASCVQCLPGCQICSSTGCTKCLPQWYFYGEDCVTTCPLGYSPISERCELRDLTPPDPSMFVNPNNSLTVSFSKPIHMNLTASDMRINVTDTSDVSYSLVWSHPIVLNESSFLINLSIDSPSLPDDNQCLLTFLRPDTVVDLLGVAIVKTQLLGVLYGYGKASSSLSNATLKASAAAVAQGSVGAVAATSIISGSPASFWSLLNQLQMITYIPMTSMPVPNGLMATLGALNIGTMVPNPFTHILPTNITSQQPPDYAQRYEVESSLFLLNTGLMVTTALVLLLGFIPIYVLSKCSSGPFSLYLRRFLPSFKWGIPLRWWIQSYLDITIYSLLEIQQALTHNGLSEAAVCLNFLLSLVLICLSLATPILSYLFLWKHYSQMTTREDQAFNKRWGVLYLEFDQTQGLGGLMYYPLFLTRRLVYALTIIWLYDYPKSQAVLNTSMAFAVSLTQTLLYVFIRKPFPERIDQLGAIVGEASTLAVFSFSCFFFLSLSQSLMDTVETVAVWTVLGAIGVNAVLSALRTVYTFVTVYKEYRRLVLMTERSKIVSPVFLQSIQTQGKAPGHKGLIMD